MYKQVNLIFLILISFFSAAFAYERASIGTLSKYWVYLKPEALATQTDKTISPRAQKRLLQKGLSGELLLPGTEIRQKLTHSVKVIKFYSKSLQAYCVICDSDAAEKISTLDFVQQVVSVKTGKRQNDDFLVLSKFLADSIDYGNSLNQLEMLNIPAVHDSGLTGEGVLITIIDTGFRKNHEIFSNIINENRLVDEWDFIENDADVQDPNEDTRQNRHGTGVWSIVGGYKEGELIGPAFGADFALAKTEVMASETRIEEDYFVAAVERADSLGADIITASLGYRDFDDFIYPYEAIDGETSVTTQAANWAYMRGIVFVNSVGNEASNYNFDDGGVMTPADGYGVLAVGAVDSEGNRAGFSSYGPTYDGRIKPDVCAKGYSTHFAASAATDIYTYSNGTSYAAPLIAGSIALLLEKYPMLHPETVYELVRKGSDRWPEPDQKYGWGIPDFQKIIFGLSELPAPAGKVAVFPNPGRDYINFYLQTTNSTGFYTLNVKIYNLLGQLIWKDEIPQCYNGKEVLYRWDLANFSGQDISSGIYFLTLQGNGKIIKEKFTIIR